MIDRLVKTIKKWDTYLVPRPARVSETGLVRHIFILQFLLKNRIECVFRRPFDPGTMPTVL